MGGEVHCSCCVMLMNGYGACMQVDVVQEDTVRVLRVSN